MIEGRRYENSTINQGHPYIREDKKSTSEYLTPTQLTMQKSSNLTLKHTTCLLNVFLIENLNLNFYTKREEAAYAALYAAVYAALCCPMLPYAALRCPTLTYVALRRPTLPYAGLHGPTLPSTSPIPNAHNNANVTPLLFLTPQFNISVPA